MLLKMAPRSIHLLLTDGSYAWRHLIEIPWYLVSLMISLDQMLIGMFRWIGRLFSLFWKLFSSRTERMAFLRDHVEQWISAELNLGRLSLGEASHLREVLAQEQGETADL